MSEAELSDHSSIGSISDLGGLSEEDEGTAPSPRSPPSRGNLEREANKLRSKFKILKEALKEEKVAEITQNIDAIDNDNHPDIKTELVEVEKRRGEKLKITHERKRVKVEAILNEYKAKAQALEDERKVKQTL